MKRRFTGYTLNKKIYEGDILCYCFSARDKRFGVVEKMEKQEGRGWKVRDLSDLEDWVDLDLYRDYASVIGKITDTKIVIYK
jgi:hypothetical protein